ncbi:MAG TPA: TSUP family transporter [Trebonia sp.]|nr:TSUP family transporter [Trebonia sp.]
MTLAIIVAAGALIGLSLGALGGGGSILTVPVLVYGLGQAAAQATTGSLVVVGVTSLVGAITAYRSGNVLLTRGLAFGAVAIAGSAAGARASGLVPAPVLLAAFAVLLLAVRAGSGVHASWNLVVLLTAVAIIGAWAGARVAARADTSKLQASFTVLLVLVAGYTAWRALPGLI